MRLSLLLVLGPTPALAATLTVGPSGDHATLAEALAVAADGDTLVVEAGDFAEGGLVVDRRLTIEGAGDTSGGTALTGDGPVFTLTDAGALTLRDLAVRPASGRVATVDGGTLTLEQVSLANGSDPEQGGALWIEGGALTAEGGTWVDNRSPDGFGGHLYALDATLTLTDLEIRGGRAERGGALWIDGGTTVITGSTFETNGVRSDDDRGVGGAIGAERVDLTIRDSTFRLNRAIDGQGGAISTYLGRLTLEDVTLVGDPEQAAATEYFGGGIAAFDTRLTWTGGSASDLGVSHTGTDGTFGYGGAVILYGSRGTDFLIEDVDFVGSRATAFGGAIRIDAGQGTVRGCTFEGGLADYGAGIHVATAGPVVVEESRFIGNEARYAAAIRLRPSSSEAAEAELVLRRNHFEGNVAERYGGVMYARAARRVVLDGNTAWDNTAQLGGALMLWDIDEVEVVRNHFCLNRAEGGTTPDGGAIATYLAGRAGLTVAHNVFQENRATSWGGAVSLLQGGAADLRHNTFLGNRAAEGAAVAARGTADAPQQADLVANLVAYSSAGDGVAGDDAALTFSHNAFWSNLAADLDDGLGPLDASHVLVDPLLQAYDPDGRCDDDRPWPALGSPLIDAGPTDGRDPDGSVADIGASGGEGAPPELWADGDEDGAPALWDCDDADPDRAPDRAEVPYDGIDQDCDGTDLRDADGDGYEGGEDGEDCDDTDPDISPGAAEVWYDGVDQDCDEADDFDADGDGARGDGGPDCDDGDPTIYPGAADATGDGVDQDCDGVDGFTPEGPEPDATGCGCASTGAGGWPLLGLLGLLALRRRR